MSPEQQYFDAAARGDRETLARLLADHPHLRGSRDKNGLSAVMQACYNHHPEIAAWLADQAESLDLHEAAATGRVRDVEARLADRPQEIDSYSADGWTALHLAAFFGHPPVIALLAERGASRQLPSRSGFALGNTPLHAAVAGGSADAVAALIACGADIDARQEPGGFTPLHIAAFQSDPKMARALLAAGADPALRDDQERTPLEIAQEKQNTETALALQR